MNIAEHLLTLTVPRGWHLHQTKHGYWAWRKREHRTWVYRKTTRKEREEAAWQWAIK